MDCVRHRLRLFCAHEQDRVYSNRLLEYCKCDKAANKCKHLKGSSKMLQGPFLRVKLLFISFQCKKEDFEQWSAATLISGNVASRILFVP